MSGILREVRYAIRVLRKSLGTSAIAVLALGLGIGLTTIMFSIVYGAVWKGLPFEDSAELLHLERNNLARDIAMHSQLVRRDAWLIAAESAKRDAALLQQVENVGKALGGVAGLLNKMAGLVR